MAFIGKNVKVNTATYSPQSAKPSNPAEGMIFRSDGTALAEGLWEYRDSNWKKVPEISNPSTFGLVNGDNTDTSDFDTTGLTNCTLGTETTNPLSGKTSFKFTNVTGGSTEYAATPGQTVPIRSRGNQIAVKFKYKYDGDDSDLSVSIYDNTGTATLESLALPAASVATEAAVIAYLPSTSSDVELRITCDTVNNGKILIIDDLEFTDDPYVFKNIYKIAETRYHITSSSQTITSGATDKIEFDIKDYDTHDAWDTTNDKFVAPFPGTYSVKFVLQLSGGSDTNTARTVVYLYKNGAQYMVWDIIPSNTTSGYSVFPDACSTDINLAEGDDIDVRVTHNTGSTETVIDASIAIKGIAENEYIVHAGSGTENVFSARITSADAITSQSSPDTPAIASVSSGSTGLYVITYTSSFFSVIPAVQATAETNGLNCHITAESTSGCTVNIEDPSGTLTDSDFSITIQRQGTDYKHPNAYAVVDNNKDQLKLVDGVTAPDTVAGVAQIYVDTADGDLKVKFGDGTVKTISTDT